MNANVPGAADASADGYGNAAVSDGTSHDGPVEARFLPDGGVEVTAAAYRLTVAADGVTALLHSRADERTRESGTSPEDGRAGPSGGPLLLQLPGAIDRMCAYDETLSVSAPQLENGPPHPYPRITVERRSTAWRSALTRIDCTPRGPQMRWEVSGAGRITTVLPFAVRAAFGGRGGGLRPSGHDWRTLFTPNPGPPRRLTRGAGESAVVGASGDARPGRGHWFFTPAPLCLALTGEALPDDADPGAPPESTRPGGRDGAPRHWWTVGVGDRVGRLTFTGLTYVPSDQGFHLELDYEGHTGTEEGHDACDEEDPATFTTPAVLVSPGHPDPYSGLRAHREWLTGHGWAPATESADSRFSGPSWWHEPMFCGWGAQSARARETGREAPDLSTSDEYDAHLAHLARHGLVPGTVVIDDKWQRAYGSWEPDTAKWPDLRDWIARRHAAGQKVLLWWRAWATEGVADELCVRTPDGRPVALDPGHPGARRLLAGNISRMLSPDPGGLGADGLKIDFTADTPSGPSLVSHGPHWGIALLHRQLAVIHEAAKAARPDALIVTHTPHPAFTDVTDMIRLNDMLRLDDPDPYAPIVPQMRFRAAVVEAACPGLPVDTDDWCAPDLREWRAYCAAKHELGVPALYVSDRLDRTGEELEEHDYAALRESWARWRSGLGDGERGHAVTGTGAGDGRRPKS